MVFRRICDLMTFFFLFRTRCQFAVCLPNSPTVRIFGFTQLLEPKYNRFLFHRVLMYLLPPHLDWQWMYLVDLPTLRVISFGINHERAPPKNVESASHCEAASLFRYSVSVVKRVERGSHPQTSQLKGRKKEKNHYPIIKFALRT